MAIRLPNNFKKDIQGRDTSLFPVVVIGNWDYESYEGANWDDWINKSLLLSTNSFSFTKNISGSPTTANCLPILKSLPSLSEGLDIDNRKYKINSIGLDISNLPFEGKRMSERISEQFGSSINTECRVYWWSPTTDWIEPLDISGAPTPPGTSAMQIFTGIIHRYDHGDENVRMTVEDLSQTKLHKSIPVADIGAGNEVPDKYKNKPFPMVYGDVDRSPCLMTNVVTYGDSNKIDVEFLCDNSDKSSFDVENSRIGTLSFFEDGYVDILENITNDLSAEDNLYETGIQYIRDGNKLRLASARFKEASVDTYYSSLGTKVAYCRKIMHPMNVNMLDENDSDYETGGSQQGHGLHYGIDFEESSLFYSQELDTITSGSLLDILGNGSETMGFWGYTQLHTTPDWTQKATVLEFQLETLPEDMITSSANWLIGDMVFQNTSFGTGSVYDETGLEIHFRFGQSGLETRNIVIRQEGATGSGYDNSIFATRYFNINQPNDTYRFSLDKETPINMQMWTFPIKKSTHTPSHENFPDNRWCSWASELTSVGLISNFWVKDLFNKDFFCHARGRRWGNTEIKAESFQEIVGSIMFTELGQVLPDIFQSEYENWQYDFTIAERVDSKKLIEDFAKASPFLPHFDNLGNFKISQIAQQGGVLSDLDGNETIKDEDVIDFSFSRTSIENVFTKIILKYNWSYGRKEFASSIEVNVDDTFGEAYNHAYYGFPDDYSESTLLDEERGKFIRKQHTALKLARWLIYWHSNQHLKMKIKLPLKYMNLQIGDIVKFDKLLGGIAPYGINYTTTTLEGDVAFNGQPYYPTFIISKTKKTIQYCEIDVIQLHNCSDCVPEGDGKNGGGKNGEGDGEGSGMYDCAGICNGNAVVDACGVCGGTETDLTNCPCPGTVIDTLTGIDSGLPGCNPPNCNYVMDCNGDCIDFPSEAIQMDPCGVCDGDGSTCSGCANPGALDYDPNSNCPGCNCLFTEILVNDQGYISCCETAGEDNYCNDLLAEAGWDPNSAWYQLHPELIINTHDFSGIVNDYGQPGAIAQARAVFEDLGGMDVYNSMTHDEWMKGGEGSNRPIIYTTNPEACQTDWGGEVYLKGGFSLYGNNVNGILLRNNHFGAEFDSEVGLEHYHIPITRFGEEFQDIITEFRLNYYFCDTWDYQNLECAGTSEPWIWDGSSQVDAMRSIHIYKCLTEDCNEKEEVWNENMLDVTGASDSWAETVYPPWFDAITPEEWFAGQELHWDEWAALGRQDVKFLVEIWTWDDFPFQQNTDFVNFGKMKFFITLDLTDYCLLGDIAGDGVVGSEEDWVLWFANINQWMHHDLQYLCAADMNCSGLIETMDFGLMQLCWENMENEGFDNCADYLLAAYPEWAGCAGGEGGWDPEFEGGGGGGESYDPSEEEEDQPPAIFGCMDNTACNYNADATEDDGSCVMSSWCWDDSMVCEEECPCEPIFQCWDGSFVCNPNDCPGQPGPGTPLTKEKKPGGYER